MQPIWRRATVTVPTKMLFSANSIACTMTRPMTVLRTMRALAWARARPAAPIASHSGPSQWAPVASKTLSLTRMRTGSVITSSLFT
jgi:hypothetical protein